MSSIELPPSIIAGHCAVYSLCTTIGIAYLAADLHFVYLGRMESVEESPALDSVSALVDAVGGLDKAANLFGEKVGTVRAWRDRGWIPPRHYLKHVGLLKAAGVHGRPEIWNQEAAAA